MPLKREGASYLIPVDDFRFVDGIGYFEFVLGNDGFVTDEWLRLALKKSNIIPESQKEKATDL